MRDKVLPRGIRNHNPGNIRRAGFRWRGEVRNVETDREFCVFQSPEYGLRAVMVLLTNYQRKYALRTVADVMRRYAPPCENNTKAYINHVAAAIGVAPHDLIDLRHPETLLSCIRSIVLHENGKPPRQKPRNWYADGVFSAAFDLFIQPRRTP